jgi:hypothetical protein
MSQPSILASNFLKTTTTATTSSLAPIVTEFRLQAATQNANINNRYLKWWDLDSSRPLYFNPFGGAHIDENFTLEPETRRLKVGTHYVIKIENSLSSYPSPSLLNSYVVCASPIRLGQALDCSFQTAPHDFRLFKDSNSNAQVQFWPRSTPIVSTMFKVDLIPAL